MKSTTAILAAVALALGVNADTLTLNTPSGATGAIQCEVYQITWTGGTAPYSIYLYDGSQTYISELVSSVDASPYQWTVNEASGDSFILTIHDADGNISSTAAFTIETSSDSSCLSASASASGSATSSANATTSSANATTSATAVVPTSASASSASESSASASAASASSTASSSSRASSSSSSSSKAASSSSTATATSATSSSTTTSSSDSSSATKIVAGIFAPVMAALFALAA